MIKYHPLKKGDLIESIKGKKQVNDVIMRILERTKFAFNLSANDVLLTVLSRYVKDFLLSEIILLKKGRIDFGDEKQLLNLKSALIASELIDDDSVAIEELYKNLFLIVNEDVYDYAKNSYKTQEMAKIKDRVIALHKKLEKDKLPLTTEIVDFAITCNEFITHFPEKQEEFRLYQDVQKINGIIALEVFEKVGMANSLTCDICKLVHDFDHNKHYSLPTSIALRRMADFETVIALNHIDINMYKKFLFYTFRNIQAAMVTDRELIEPFALRFKEMVMPLLGNKKVHKK